MQHSVKFIGIQHQELSERRKDSIRFNAEEFIQFARQNAKKYHIAVFNDDLLVSSWYSSDLVKDYLKSIQ